MKIEGRLFLAVGIFLFVVTGVYWLLSKDPTGTALLLAVFGLIAIVVGVQGLLTPDG